MQQESDDKPEIGPDRSYKIPTNIQNNKPKKKKNKKSSRNASARVSNPFVAPTLQLYDDTEARKDPFCHAPGCSYLVSPLILRRKEPGTGPRAGNAALLFLPFRIFNCGGPRGCVAGRPWPVMRVLLAPHVVHALHFIPSCCHVSSRGRTTDRKGSALHFLVERKMTSHRGVVVVLAALAAMIAVTAGANLCPDFNQVSAKHRAKAYRSFVV